MPSDCLVVGATRILRPAVLELVARGHRVACVARTAEDLRLLHREAAGGVIQVAVDYRCHDLLQTRLAEAGAPFAAGICYAPQADNESLTVLRTAVSGPVVELLTSGSAAGSPDAPFDFATLPPPPEPPWRRLLLGWTAVGDWHSPAAISAAALSALDTGDDAVLGTVRPWGERPIAP